MNDKGSPVAGRNHVQGDSSSINLFCPDHCELVQSCALFDGIAIRDCKEIVACACTRTFTRNEFLFLQGQPVHTLVLLLSGSVKHTRLGPEGDEVLLRMGTMGDAFEVRVEPDSNGHTFSARAVEKCQALVWRYARLHRVLSRYPQTRQNISQILASRILKLQEGFRELATKLVAQQLALALLRNATKAGKPSDVGIQVSLSRDELAQMTGATVYTISRIISRWSEQGFISSRVRALHICDVMQLEAISNDNERQLKVA